MKSFFVKTSGATFMKSDLLAEAAINKYINAVFI